MASKKKRRKMSAKRRLRITITVIVMLVLIAVAYRLISEGAKQSTMRAALDRTTFFDGIYINNIHVGGMTSSQAKNALSSVLGSTVGEFKLLVAYEDMSWTVDSQSLEISFNTEEVLKEAQTIGRSAPTMEENYQKVLDLKTNPVYLTVESSVDSVEMDSLMDEISGAINVPRQDADVVRFSRSDGFTFSQEQTGREVDTLQLKELILSRFRSKDFGKPVPVPVSILKPEVTKAELEASFKRISSFKSQATNNSARNQNITLALAAIDGSIVEPGEEFSINEATGKRSADKGYQEAGAIKDGILIPEFGGGVCQVSTSLFNAVARADLEVTERNNHSYPSTYIDIGMDAMIDYPASDFKFVNTTGRSIYVSAWFDKSDHVIHVELYGVPVLENGVTIKLRSEVTETIPQPADIVKEDPAVQVGQVIETRVGRTGYRTNTYKQYVKDDKVVEEALLCTSYYRAIAAIYTVGTGAAAEPTPQPVAKPPAEETPAAETPAPQTSPAGG